jgi:hypothetical protein
LAYVRAIVYGPPNQDFPFLAVVFGSDGQATTAKAFGSAELAEAFLAQEMPKMQAKIEQQAGKDESDQT